MGHEDSSLTTASPDWTIRAIHEQTIYTTTIKISSDSPKYFLFFRTFSLASPILYFIAISCVGTMNTDSGVVATDGKLQALLALERRIGVSGYGHNYGGGYLAWLLTTYLWPNMDTEGSYHVTLVTASPCCQNVKRNMRAELALFPIIWEVLAHEALKLSARNIELDAFYFPVMQPKVDLQTFQQKDEECSEYSSKMQMTN